MTNTKSNIEMEGLVTEIRSYNELDAQVLIKQGYGSILQFGAIVEIKDSEDPNLRFVATVTDISEKGLLPSIDESTLQDLYNSLLSKGANPSQIDEILRKHVIPGIHRVFSIRQAKLRILGELSIDQKGNITLKFHRRPPRPYSRILNPGVEIIKKLLRKGEYPFIFAPLYWSIIADSREKIYAYLDAEKLNMHMAIVGQTGSGKTETVKRLLLEYYLAMKKFGIPFNITIFDITGEYLGYPYKTSDTVSLLDAITNPWKYTCDRKPDHIDKFEYDKLTVLVPYAVDKIGEKEDDVENYLKHETGDLIKYLKNKEQLWQIKAFLIGRSSFYQYEESGFKEIKYDEIENLLNTKQLLIAIPHPDVMDLDLIQEISGTKSEYAIDAIANIANILDLFDYGKVKALTFIKDIISIISYISGNIKNTKEKGKIPIKFSHAINEIINELRKKSDTIKNKTPKEMSKEVRNIIISKINEEFSNNETHTTSKIRLEKILQEGSEMSWLYYFTLPKWRSNGIIDPLDKNILTNALEEEIQGGKIWKDYIYDAIQEVARMLVSTHLRAETIRSIINILRKVTRRTSPVLNYHLYKSLMERFLDGNLTFVLLAPPSTGATDHVIGTLLEESFNHAIYRFRKGVFRKSLLVIEEAHNLAPSRDWTPSKPQMIRISREGRKWGVGLIVVTQRPSFVDPDVLSQAGSIISLRITNPEDLSGLRRSVESIAADYIDKLPDLDRGQAIISGMVVPERKIPLLVQVIPLTDQC